MLKRTLNEKVIMEKERLADYGKKIYDEKMHESKKEENSGII